jgi:glycosyltransferase involved in cell wall biosynthesis
MYDCNDPDTLCAGVFAKEKYNSKILYDSHEFWQGTRRKEYNLLYTIYSYIGNTIQYHREKSLVHNVDGITTVSESIANILRYKYNKPVCVIENRATLNKYRIGNYENTKIPSANAVFFGAKIRPGTIDTLLALKKEGFKPMIIGDYSNDKLTDLGIECLGFLDKDSYQKELAKSCVAVLDFEVTCDNIKYCLPNKLFEYIQAGIPIIANDRLFDVSRFIKDKKIGVVCNVYNIKDKIREIITEYHKYRHNINNISYEYSWENQEKQLLSYYSLFMDVE